MTWIVDGSGTVAGAHATGVDALISGQPVAAGDTIRVKGLVHNGLLHGYTDTPILAGQAVENWPIDLPEGVTIQPYDATPVLIYASQPTTQPLISVTGTASTSQTTIHDLYLIGGGVGISVDHTGSHQRTVRVSDCTFAQNRVGLSAVANGSGAIAVDIVGCELRPDNGMLSHLTVNFQDPLIGFRLQAESHTAAPRVDATLSGVQAIAGYTITSTATAGNRPWNYHGSSPSVDWELGNRDPRRVVDVYACGGHREHPGTTTVPIAEVTVDLGGCDFNGSDGAWDFGIYSGAEGAPEEVGGGDYYGGYRVNVGGCKLEDFGHAGILATIGDSGRGVMSVFGDSLVTGTGPGQTRTAPSPAYSGILAQSYLGMLAVLCNDMQSNDNSGHGVHLHARESRMEPDIYPVGLHFAADDSEFHGNGGCGIAMAAGWEQFSGNPAQGHGIVGGTWRNTSTGSALRTLTGGTDQSVLPSDQGRINRCAISNNGEFGIYAFAGSPSDSQSIVDCRVTNSIIWNNPYGGIFGHTGTATGNQTSSQIHLILPIIHCTVVGNGTSGLSNPYAPSSSGVDFSIEFYENWPPPAYAQDTSFEWNDPLPGGDRATVLFNTIFDRLGGSTVPDVGPQLTQYVRTYSAPFTIPTAPNFVHVAGCRGYDASTSVFGTSGIGSATQFMVGTPNLGLRDATQFFLASTGPGNIFTSTAGFAQFGAGESVFDYSLQPRDPVTNSFPNLPERGADEY